MLSESPLEFVQPEWPAPACVRGLTTTRIGGFSDPPYDGFNLGDHVGDRPDRVAMNRTLLEQSIPLPQTPEWLEQVHGCEVTECASPRRRADAVYSRQPGQVCAVLTADCLPLLICSSSGDRVAAVHAGWRGLAAGVIQSAVTALALPGEALMAWMGPAIGPGRFEVGGEVRETFLAQDPASEAAFVANRPGHWLADIYALAGLQLKSLDFGYVGGGDYCTVTDRARFFSYRRDAVCGRMASLIWIEPD